MQNKNLHDKLAELISQIMEIINLAASERGLPVYHESEWISNDNRHYHRQIIRKILWQSVITEMDEILKKLPSYILAQNIAEDDEVFGSHIKYQVHTIYGSRKITFADIVYAILLRILPKGDLPKFELEKFSIVYEEIEENFLSPTISTIEITPLFGFRSEEPRISIANGLNIEIMGEEEISKLLSSGIQLSLHNISDNIADVIYKHAIVRVSKLTKIIGSANLSHKAKETESENRVSRDTIISALRLFKFGTIFPLAIITRNIGFFSIGSSFSSGFPRYGIGSSYVLSKKEIEEFLKLWNQIYELSPKKIPHFLEVALRRFADGTLRPNLEDKIIDLLISAEAIFLSSGGNDQGELKYRLAHRAALFLESEPKKQKKVFNFMKRAYDIRSAFVHGSSSKIKLPEKEDGSKMQLTEFESQLRDLMRHAIIKIFNLAYQRKDSHLNINWDDYIFPELEGGRFSNPMLET
ncbi:HEPN domain-containing protein [Leptospira santarosai]|uniref:HEPN domain-containing protein n=1 Tax=Leptospira santarosai TaxID=28183 RepID=UPI001E64CFC3|nr:HEPN domain-containing protein [Leptospira santarosai]